MLCTGYSSILTTKGEINEYILTELLSTCKDEELELNKSFKNDDLRGGISWLGPFILNLPILMVVARNRLFNNLEEVGEYGATKAAAINTKNISDVELNADDILYNNFFSIGLHPYF